MIGTNLTCTREIKHADGQHIAQDSSFFNIDQMVVLAQVYLGVNCEVSEVQLEAEGVAQW